MLGNQIFSLSHARDMLIISSSHLFTELKINHLSFFHLKDLFQTAFFFLGDFFHESVQTLIKSSFAYKFLAVNLKHTFF